MINTHSLLKIPKESSINRRFSYALIVVVAVILFIFATTVIFIEINTIDSTLENRSNNALKLSQISLSIPLWELNNNTIDGFVEALFLDDTIVYANIVVDDGTNLGKSRPPFNGKDFSYFQNTSGFVAKSADILYEEKKIGIVQLAMSREHVQREIILNIISIVMLTIFVIAAILITSLLITRKFISRPLFDLQSSATLIANGNLDAPINTSTDDEIGKLARDFNAMRESIKNLFEEQRESNRTLEQKVRERTQELQQELAERKRAETALQQRKQALESALGELKKHSGSINSVRENGRLRHSGGWRGTRNQ